MDCDNSFVVKDETPFIFRFILPNIIRRIMPLDDPYFKENPTFIRSYINHLVEVSCILSFRLACDVVHECTLSCSQSTFTFKKENWVRVKKYIEPKLGENEK